MTRGVPLRIGTRASRLAIWQSEWVGARLRAVGHPVDLVPIHTAGDTQPDIPLSRLDAGDLFTRQIDQALLEGEVDLAVHSLKDLPTALPQGIELAAVTTREDPRDALVARGAVTWDALPAGSVVATCSLRRRAQMLHARPDLVPVDIRGNIEGRLEKLERHGEWHATILAVAGLVRLNLSGRIGTRLDPQLMLPAPGQGAIGVTARRESAESALVRKAVHDPGAAVCVTAERAFLHHLGCGCHAPVGALCASRGSSLSLSGRVLSLDGRQCIEADRSVADRGSESSGEECGMALAEHLLGRGADRLLESTMVDR